MTYTAISHQGAIECHFWGAVMTSILIYASASLHQLIFPHRSSSYTSSVTTQETHQRYRTNNQRSGRSGRSIVEFFEHRRQEKLLQLYFKQTANLYADVCIFYNFALTFVSMYVFVYTLCIFFTLCHSVFQRHHRPMKSRNNFPIQKKHRRGVELHQMETGKHD